MVSCNINLIRGAKNNVKRSQILKISAWKEETEASGQIVLIYSVVHADTQLSCNSPPNPSSSSQGSSPESVIGTSSQA